MSDGCRAVGSGMAILMALGLGASAACAQPPPPDGLGDPGMSEPAGALGARDVDQGYLRSLLVRSCPPGVLRQEPEALSVRVRSVPLQVLNPMRRSVGMLTFVAGFHLTSVDSRFGGFSGLDLQNETRLLTVTDAGDLIGFDLADDGLTPVRAHIGRLRDSRGVAFVAKSEADAEGIAVSGDVAFISFEGMHRVLAYNIGSCGASARGVTVVDTTAFSDAFSRAGLEAGPNRGVEGLAVSTDWKLFIGLETRNGQASLISARPFDALPEFNVPIGYGAPDLVGLDLLPAGEGGRDIRLFSLHRSSDAFANNAISLVETYLEAKPDPAPPPGPQGLSAHRSRHPGYALKTSRVLAEMNLLVTIDNFEGLAVRSLPDGGVRIFLISDDNFSLRQRTLLMIYDLRSQG